MPQLLGKGGSLRNRLIKAASGIAGIRLLSNAINFVTVILLTRLLGAEGYGLFVFVLAWVTILAAPAKLGFDGLLVREVAVYLRRKDDRLLNGILGVAHRVVLGSSVFFAGVALVILLQAADWDFLNPLNFFAVLLIPIWAFMGVKQAAVRGTGRVVRGQLGETVIGPAVFLGLVFLAGVSSFTLESSADATALRIIAAAVALAAAWLLYRSYVSRGITTDEKEERVGDWMKSGARFAVLESTMGVQNRLTLLILGYMMSMEAVAVFAIASRVVDLIAVGVKAVTVALAPSFAGIYESGDKARLEILVRKSTRIVFVVTIPLVAFLITVKEPVVAVFGKGFEAAALPLTILAVGRIGNAAFASVQMLLNMCGREALSLIAGVSAVAVNGALSVLLIPMWGVAGASVAQALSRLGQAVLQAYFVNRYLGVRPGI